MHTDIVGVHYVLELYECVPALLNDADAVQNAIIEAAERAHATLLKVITHRFEGQGITGLGLLAESHLSIHTWPECGYAAIDIFTCGSNTEPESACNFLIERFGAQSHVIIVITRGTTPAALTMNLQPYTLGAAA